MGAGRRVSAAEVKELQHHLQQRTSLKYAAMKAGMSKTAGKYREGTGLVLGGAPERHRTDRMTLVVNHEGQPRRTRRPSTCAGTVPLLRTRTTADSR
jgi:hypothetical protein